MDLAAVYAIEKLSFPNPWHVETFLGEIQNRPVSHALVAVHGPEETIVGYIVFWIVRDEAQINNIAVHPDRRGKGFGRGMLAATLEEMKASGIKTVTLEVRESNLTALGLYRSLGFQVVGRRRDYYTNPREDALAMLLRFGP
ncbi:MAG: ribosomal protein S18-alanine N-acetyltransferase [Candidatus Aminicenantes bacterium]|nr:ribosomal protein S18-alanine N-acetyltransferase [Candidatus Aminicenantes bacterium]